MAVPIPLLLAAAGLLLLKSRSSGGSGKSPLDRGVKKLNLLEDPLLLKAQLIKKGVPIYKGFPSIMGMAVPEGYEFIDVWVTKDGQTGPEPRRFTQWHEVVDTPGFKDGNDEAVRSYQAQYYFGVADGKNLTFYAVGKKVTGQRCCAHIKCDLEDSWNDSQGHHESTENVESGFGGTVAGWMHKLGPAWTCTCAGLADGCYELMEPPKVNWPTV